MLPELFDDERRALRRAATMLITGALAVIPVTAHFSSYAGAATAQEPRRISPAVLPPRMTFASIDIARDPFVPIHVPSGLASPQAQTADSSSGTQVRAIVSGTPTRALIEEAGVVRIVGAGDRIGERTILGIGSGGITLSDGSRIPMPQASP